MSDFEKENNV